jgi:hypothetical protein
MLHGFGLKRNTYGSSKGCTLFFGVFNIWAHRLKATGLSVVPLSLHSLRERLRATPIPCAAEALVTIALGNNQAIQDTGRWMMDGGGWGTVTLKRFNHERHKPHEQIRNSTLFVPFERFVVNILSSASVCVR